MREITEAEKRDIIEAFLGPLLNSFGRMQKAAMEWLFEELTKRGFKIVKDEE